MKQAEVIVTHHFNLLILQFLHCDLVVLESNGKVFEHRHKLHALALDYDVNEL